MMNLQQTDDLFTECKADLIRAALLAYASMNLGRERSLCEQLAAQAEVMADSVQ